MTVIDYIRTIFITTGTRILALSLIWHFKPTKVNDVVVDAPYGTIKCTNVIIQSISVCVFCSNACKQIIFPFFFFFLKAEHLPWSLTGKNTNSKKALKPTKRQKHRKIDSKCESLTYFYISTPNNKIYRKVRIRVIMISTFRPHM